MWANIFTNMQIIKEYPPNYAKIKEILNPPDTVCFTYGSTIYNPSGNEIKDDLLIHEQVHEKQQTNPEEWWDRYLIDKDFRLEQELEAYATQYNWIKERENDVISKLYLEFFAKQLFELYKIDLLYPQCLTKIRRKGKDLTTKNNLM